MNHTQEEIIKLITESDLTYRERLVVIMRLTGVTLDEIGAVIKPVRKEMQGKTIDGRIDRERVRQIEAKAIRKLRHPSRFGKVRK